jgi:hypothetical protein
MRPYGFRISGHPDFKILRVNAARLIALVILSGHRMALHQE